MTERAIVCDTTVLLYLIPTVRPLLDAVIAQGFRMHADLYRDVLRMAQEDAT